MYSWTNLEPDTYTITLLVNTGWSITNPLDGYYTIVVTSMTDTTGIDFGVTTIDSTTMFRTFTTDELLEKVSVRKKISHIYWTFTFVNTTDSTVDGIHVEFSGGVDSFTTVDPFTYVDNLNIRNQHWEFSGASILPGDTAIISGYTSYKTIRAKYKWLKGGKALGRVFSSVVPIERIDYLPMPNAANIREELFLVSGSFTVGIPRRDSARYYGWVRLRRSFDMYNSLSYRYVTHTGTPRGFTVLARGGRIIGEYKVLSPQQFNNRLYANLMAMKFNIQASAWGITPPGLGELIYSDTTNPLNGLMIKEITDRADSAMTMWRYHSAGEYINYDTTLRRILLAFSGAVDTVSWSTGLIVKGTRPVGAISFLRYNSSIAPVIHSREPWEEESAEPASFTLNQNYPNPFNPYTTIEFELPEPSVVQFQIINILGQVVTTVFDQELMDAGRQAVEFNASNLASGIYFYRLEARDLETNTHVYHDVKKMIYLK